MHYLVYGGKYRISNSFLPYWCLSDFPKGIYLRISHIRPTFRKVRPQMAFDWWHRNLLLSSTYACAWYKYTDYCHWSIVCWVFRSLSSGCHGRHHKRLFYAGPPQYRNAHRDLLVLLWPDIWTDGWECYCRIITELALDYLGNVNLWAGSLRHISLCLSRDISPGDSSKGSSVTAQKI